MYAPMADVTREEIDAKLEAAEARTETRYVELLAKIDRVTEVGVEARSAARTTQLTVVVTAIASVLAILAVMLQSQGNLLSAFQAGIAAQSVSVPPPK